MNNFGRTYADRWSFPDHDGLTLANIEGAVRLGWLTRAEADELLEDE